MIRGGMFQEWNIGEGHPFRLLNQEVLSTFDGFSLIWHLVYEEIAPRLHACAG